MSTKAYFEQANRLHEGLASLSDETYVECCASYLDIVRPTLLGIMSNRGRKVTEDARDWLHAKRGWRNLDVADDYRSVLRPVQHHINDSPWEDHHKGVGSYLIAWSSLLRDIQVPGSRGAAEYVAGAAEEPARPRGPRGSLERVLPPVYEPGGRLEARWTVLEQIIDLFGRGPVEGTPLDMAARHPFRE